MMASISFHSPRAARQQARSAWSPRQSRMYHLTHGCAAIVPLVSVVIVSDIARLHCAEHLQVADVPVPILCDNQLEVSLGARQRVVARELLLPPLFLVPLVVVVLAEWEHHHV